MRIIKRELVVRLTTEKGSVLYEPAEPDMYVLLQGGLSRAFYECPKDEADGALFDINLFEDNDDLPPGWNGPHTYDFGGRS